MNNIASSKSLGFGIFAIAAWLTSLHLSGFTHFSYMHPPHTIAAFASIGLLIAAIAAFLRKETWLAFFFMLWTATFWAGGAAALSGWAWLGLALVNFYLALAATKGRQEPAVALIALLIAICALGQGLDVEAGLDLAGQIGGYFGLAATLVAFYVSAGLIACPSGGSKMPGLSSDNGSSSSY